MKRKLCDCGSCDRCKARKRADNRRGTGPVNETLKEFLIFAFEEKSHGLGNSLNSFESYELYGGRAPKCGRVAPKPAMS